MKNVKKILSVMMFLSAVFLLCGQDNKAEAYEKYVGTFNDGYSAYVLTETISSSAGSCSCTVKATNGRNSTYIDYQFYWNHSYWSYQSSEGYGGEVTSSTPVTKNILHCIMPGALIRS